MEFFRRFRTRLLLGAALVASALASGCASDKITGSLVPNQRPSVELTQAPISTDGEYFYAYRINWSGYDPDGRIAYYEYAIDPPTFKQASAGAETVWVRTERNEQIFFFRASRPDPGGAVADTARDFHTFVIRAVDDSGDEATMRSPQRSRSFFAYTVAPTVRISNPTPSRLLQPTVTPSVSISWNGQDPDGQFTQKPVKYKYKLFRPGDVPSIQTWTQDPDSLRRFFDPIAFAGWDSTSAETTTVQFTNLTPNQQYMFVLIGIDEAGAYSPEFTLDTNMLLFNVGFAGTSGPRFTVFNSFFRYTYPTGGYSTDELAVIKIEVPERQVLEFNWFAEPPAGSLIEFYRWAVDIADLTDDTPRTDENTDLSRWSQKSPNTTSCRIGPFEGSPTPKTLYIEAGDNNGFVSLAIVRFTIVKAALDRPLLFVDDTRLNGDQFNTTTGCLLPYGTAIWPTAAELDTFLYARGNVPWRGLPANCPTLPTNPVLSPPGLFAGFDFDTLGTRRGFERVSTATPLSLLGRYAHVVWMLDGIAALADQPLSPARPMTALRFMSLSGELNTLAAYMALGGRVWLMGGGAAYANMISVNRPANDEGLFGTVFANETGELVSGRMMHDFFGWRSELLAGGLTTAQFLKSPRAVGGWSHADLRRGGTINAPNYALLPPQMRRRTTATDPVPLSRTSTVGSAFYRNNLNVEYLSAPNFVIEDVNPDPDLVSEQSVVDTIYAINGGAGNLHPQGSTFQRPLMTYYHGANADRSVFSGFGVWDVARADAQVLADFVLQQIWGLTRTTVVQPLAPVAAPAPATNRISTPAQRALHARLPVGRTRGE